MDKPRVPKRNKNRCGRGKKKSPLVQVDWSVVGRVQKTSVRTGRVRIKTKKVYDST
jgi:hypothetical protein